MAHGGAALPLINQRLVKYWMDGKNDIFDTSFFELTATTEHAHIAALMAMAKPNRCMISFDFPFMGPDWFDALQETYNFQQPGWLHDIQYENALRTFPKVKERLVRAGQLS